MSKNQTPLKIDIDKVLASKSQTLSKFTPKFAINYLKRTVHQDELNALLEKYAGYTGVDFAEKLLHEFNVCCNVTFEDRSALLPSQKYIFVCNHPLGGLDGIIIINEISRLYNKKVMFVVNDLLMNIKPLEDIFIPVNTVKHGTMSKEYARKIEDAYRSSNQILYFPAGLCSRKINGSITDLEWKGGYIKQALKYNRSIVPMHLIGQNSNFFYRLANIRKALGIKFNIEMIYLPDEMFRQKNRTFGLFVGKPIDIEEIRQNPNIRMWNRLIREKSYSLK